MDVTVQNRDFMAQNQYLHVLGGWLRASNRSQPNTVTEIRYSSPNSTARDYVMITRNHWNPRSTHEQRVLAPYRDIRCLQSNHSDEILVH